jgi:hypothetical protein
MGSEWILGRLAGECRLDLVGSGQGPVAGSCEYGDEPSGSGYTELVNRLVQYLWRFLSSQLFCVHYKLFCKLQVSWYSIVRETHITTSKAVQWTSPRVATRFPEQDTDPRVKEMALVWLVCIKCRTLNYTRIIKFQVLSFGLFYVLLRMSTLYSADETSQPAVSCPFSVAIANIRKIKQTSNTSKYHFVLLHIWWLVSNILEQFWFISEEGRCVMGTRSWRIQFMDVNTGKSHQNSCS